MILRKRPLVFTGGDFFRRIGMISYSVYLVHEEIGLLLINYFHEVLGKLAFLAPLIVITILTGFAELSFRWYEQSASLLIKHLLNRSTKS